MTGVSSKELASVLRSVARTPGFDVELKGQRAKVTNRMSGEFTWIKTGSSHFDRVSVHRLLKNIGWPPQGDPISIFVETPAAELLDIPVPFVAPPEPMTPEPQEEPMVAQPPPPPEGLKTFAEAALEFLADHAPTMFTVEEIVDSIGTYGLKRNSCGPLVSKHFLGATGEDLWLHVHRTIGQRPIRYRFDASLRRAETQEATVEDAYNLVGTHLEVLALMKPNGLLLMAEDGSVWTATSLTVGGR